MKLVVLDTSAYSHLLHQHASLLEIVEQADTVFFSPVVLGELFAAFKKGTQEKKNCDLLQAFLDEHTTICDVTADTAKIYGSVYSALKKQGTPIPMNDVWIAAQCMEFGAELLTFDKHFERIPGLRVWFGGGK